MIESELGCEEYHEFISEVRAIPLGASDLLDFCRRKIIHGTPYAFHGREDDYYYFLKQISDNFLIPFNCVHISGSGKLGFSFIKKTKFSLESDIDVAIISQYLFDKIMSIVGDFQLDLRKNLVYLNDRQHKDYIKFLKYSAMGWIRPDLLPRKSHPNSFRTEWFDFFKSISHDKCLAGNYPVTAGVFKTYERFEKYTLLGLESLTVNV